MDEILKVISAIYDAAIDASNWDHALRGLSDLSDAEGFNLFVLDHHTGLVPFNISVGVPEDIIRNYNAYYVTQDPGIDYFVKNPGGGFYYNYQHTAEEEIDSQEYYAWLQKMGGSRYYLAKTFKFGSRFSGIAAAQRSRKVGHAQTSDMELLGLIAPHLERAIQIDQLFTEVDLRVAAAYDALERLPYGVFLLGKDGTILFANEIGRRTTAQVGGLSLLQGQITATHPSDNRKLQLLIRQAIKVGLGEGLSGGGEVSVSRIGTAHPYVVKILPLAPNFRLFTKDQPVALILVGDPDRQLRLKTEDLSVLYGLTVTEARIAALLAKGLRPAQVCQIQHVSENTLKTHRKHIFAKINVETQAQLSAALNAL